MRKRGRNVDDGRTRNLAKRKMDYSSRTKHPQPKIGTRYGKVLVIKIDYGPLGGIIAVYCRCDCGTEWSPHRDNLVAGKCSRCPLCRDKAMHDAQRKYDFVPEEHRERMQNIVHNAIGRCHRRPSRDYGKRGITVYAPWREDRVEFVRYLLTLPGWDNPKLVVDRTDNDGNYEPGNLRFITQSESLSNRRPYKLWVFKKVPSRKHLGV